MVFIGRVPLNGASDQRRALCPGKSGNAVEGSTGKSELPLPDALLVFEAAGLRFDQTACRKTHSFGFQGFGHDINQSFLLLLEFRQSVSGREFSATEHPMDHVYERNAVQFLS